MQDRPVAGCLGSRLNPGMQDGPTSGYSGRLYSGMPDRRTVCCLGSQLFLGMQDRPNIGLFRQAVLRYARQANSLLSGQPAVPRYARPATERRQFRHHSPLQSES
jgi:hypothetical protein